MKFPPHKRYRFLQIDWQTIGQPFGENGTVYEAEISKEHILVLFKGRNEWEVIVEPDHLLQLSEAMEENMEAVSYTHLTAFR